MTLNVKNVKGYEKMPYCHVYEFDYSLNSMYFLFVRRHYPQPKPTVVVDNPEMQRMRLLTDIQSNVKYKDLKKSIECFVILGEVS
jgi:hypothetical protein